jgi:hypothetical protein
LGKLSNDFKQSVIDWTMENVDKQDQIYGIASVQRSGIFGSHLCTNWFMANKQTISLKYGEAVMLFQSF